MTTVINVRKKYLNKLGYNNFEEWQNDKNHLYIGRGMNFYIKGAFASKWKNPFNLKKYSIDESLQLYEQHIRNCNLINQINELDGKVLGCWCKPNKCHGDVLIKLLNEHKNQYE